MSFLSEGKEKELSVSKLFDNPIFSLADMDKTQHWDFKSNEIKYDVKGLKRVNRSDNEPNESFHYIEIKNVNGRHGWLYGDADCFIFETFKYWIVVPKYKLQSFVKLNIKKTYVTSPDECLYCLYKRDGKKDVITMVTTIDLMFLASEIKVKIDNIYEHAIGDSVIPEKRLKQRLSRIKLK
jgi:hypothetical protein